jgi:hypothetical protein
MRTAADSPPPTTPNSPAPTAFDSPPPAAAAVSKPASGATTGASPGAIVASVAGSVLACFLASLLAIRVCKRRPPSKCELVSESPTEPATAYTLSLEDGREFVTDYDDFAHKDALPPLTEESDAGLFPENEPPEDARAWLPGRHEFPRGGERAVMMRSLLSQF